MKIQNIIDANYFKNLPKADLHMHLSGSLRPEDIVSIYKKLGNSSVKIDFIKKHFSFLDEIFWESLKLIMINPIGISEALNLVLDRSFHDGVKRCEIIINTGSMVKKELDTKKSFELIDKVIAKHKLLHDIDCKIRLGVNRRNGYEAVTQTSKIYKNCQYEILAGLDLNGDEVEHPTLEFIEVLQEVKKLGIPFNIHSGEQLDSLRSLKTAIQLGPRRIGHGIAIVNDSDLINLIVEKNIYLEICLTSNVKLGYVKNNESHPVLKLSKLNIPFVVATDNPGLFKTSLSEEYFKLYQLGLSIEKLNEVAMKSLTI